MKISTKKSTTFSEGFLENRLVLITGGLGALGKTIIAYLLGHGAKVAINDVLPADEFEFPPNTAYFRFDLCKDQEVETMYESINKHFRKNPDIVLCHAGKVVSQNIETLSLKDWKEVFDLNVNASFLTAKEAYRRMKNRDNNSDPGKIIFTGSWVQDVPWRGISAYNASKSALKMFMKSLAVEAAPEKITVNVIAPGIVRAGMAKKQWDTEPDYRARAEKAIPLRELQTTESVAEAILFLCSGASNYMTGSILLVDGGCSLYPTI